MTDSQENKLTMYYAVQKLVEGFAPVWATNVPFTTAFNLFKGKLPLLETKRNLQMIENTGAAKEKGLMKKELIDKAYFIANRVQSYALAVGNQDLLATVNYTYSDISHSRDTDLSGLTTNVLAKANANAAALVAYGVTTALLTDLGNVITAYAALVAKPRVAKLNTKAATEAIETLIAETDAILNERLDREIVFYINTNAEFYSQYLQSRKIIKTAKSTLAIKGTITDAATDEPIKGIQLDITNALAGARLGTDTKEVKLTKKTTAKGNFQITNLANGTYQVTASKLGYKPQVVTVNVNEGETASVVVALEKA